MNITRRRNNKTHFDIKMAAYEQMTWTRKEKMKDPGVKKTTAQMKEIKFRDEMYLNHKTG